MEARAAFVEFTALAGAIGVAKGLLTVKPIEGSLLDLHDSLKSVCLNAEPFRALFHEKLTEDNISDRELQSLLGALSLIHKALSFIIDRRRELESQEPDMLATYWPEDLQDQLIDHVENLEDLEETIALRLSPEFQSEIAAALEEAKTDKTGNRQTYRS